MQVSATLIAAQQAAREARARMALPHTQAPQASFASALQDLGAAPAAAKPASAPQAADAQPIQQPAASGRLGQHINILV